jgi:hypothetical protein
MLVDSLAQMRKGPYVCKEPIKVDWESNRKFDRIKAVYDQGWGADMLKLAKSGLKRIFELSRPKVRSSAKTRKNADRK